MFMNFIHELGLIIVNTLPVCKGLFTWYNDSEHRTGTKSLLDYFLVDQESVPHRAVLSIRQSRQLPRAPHERGHHKGLI